ncbi:CBS domain protein AcuB [Minicystis rosea]|nr:CBS domain protein AcuB [Minicystis rosea]
MSYAPRVGRYMSICPFSVRQDQPLIQAHLLMKEHRIRHLPVLDGDKLAGVISERDLHLCELLHAADPEATPVREVMATDVYAASPYTPLDEVAHEMAMHKYGSTVIVDKGKVVGVFTAVDAMAALSTILAEKLPS